MLLREGTNVVNSITALILCLMLYLDIGFIVAVIILREESSVSLGDLIFIMLFWLVMVRDCV